MRLLRCVLAATFVLTLASPASAVSADARTHWIEIPQRLPTGETQPIENFFGADRN